jgi:hypothetical protein
MDDLILASNDDGDGDDDNKDGEVQLHVDVSGCSQFLDENIPSGDDFLTVETTVNKSMTNHLMIIKAIAEECQLGGQIICDHTTTTLHRVYVDIHALQLVKSMDTFHLMVVFEKVNDHLFNIEKCMKD